MSLLSDRAFMQRFELSKYEAKQQLNSAVDSMYDKMMDQLKQWICDRDQIRIAKQQNKCVETKCKHLQTQTTIKMDSIVIKHEVCDGAECVDECRVLEQVTKLNEGLVTKSTGREMLDRVIREVDAEIEMSAHGGTHGSDNEPKRQDVNQMDNQKNENDDPIGTPINSQIDIFQNVAQPVNCQQIPQPKPVTQPQNNSILEQMWNKNDFDDEDEEQYDQELLDEVKREIEEEMEIAARNKQGQVELVEQNYQKLVNPTNGTDPIGTQVNNNSHMNFIVYNETQFQSDQMINQTTNETNQKRPVRLALRSPPPIVPGLAYGQHILDYKP